MTEKFNPDQLLLFAHSIGTRLHHYSLTSCPGKRIDPVVDKKISLIVLAASDINHTLFKNSSSNIVEAAKKVTLYVSDKDMELNGNSKYLRGNRPRVGTDGKQRLVVENIDTIDATTIICDKPGRYKCGFDTWQHSYVFENKIVRSDLYQLLKNNLPPSRRECHSREIDQKSGLNYWLFQDNC